MSSDSGVVGIGALLLYVVFVFITLAECIMVQFNLQLQQKKWCYFIMFFTMALSATFLTHVTGIMLCKKMDTDRCSEGEDASSDVKLPTAFSFMGCSLVILISSVSFCIFLYTTFKILPWINIKCNQFASRCFCICMKENAEDVISSADAPMSASVPASVPMSAHTFENGLYRV